MIHEPQVDLFFSLAVYVDRSILSKFVACEDAGRTIPAAACKGPVHIRLSG